MTATDQMIHRDPFSRLCDAAFERQGMWDPEGKFGPLFFAVEFGGEAGEILNEVKKLERQKIGAVGSRTDMSKLEEELGDGLITLINLANVYRIDLVEAARKKFNAGSERHGFPQKV